ncbi:MAG: plastocyanin/azurin family copper-binding protein [Solirubrobacteraceae bacterium]|nr:plastocyanin/azurin family copper-binding protein [Solirubrobacteraceae bacterium]
MRSRTPVALVAALVLAAGGLAACGDDDEDTGASPPPPAAAQTETTGAAGGGGGETVEVAADPGGALAFQQDSLTAPAGSVTFEFTNQANIPHDFKVEKDGEDVGGTEVVTGDTAEATVELEAGEYTFYCSVGEHRQEGMEGELTVE